METLILLIIDIDYDEPCLLQGGNRLMKKEMIFVDDSSSGRAGSFKHGLENLIYELRKLYSQKNYARYGRLQVLHDFFQMGLKVTEWLGQI